MREKAIAVKAIGRGPEPYWNAVCAAASGKLWLPAVRSEDLAVSASTAYSPPTVERTWFSSRIITPEQLTGFHEVYGDLLVAPHPEGLDSANPVLKTHKIWLYPSTAQRIIFRRWLGTARYVYNTTLDYLKTLQGPRPAWTDSADDIILPVLPEWAKEIPFQIKKMAVREACTAFSGAKKKFRKTGEWSELHYKSRKSPSQTCYIPKSAVKPHGIYPTLSGAMKYGESLPDKRHDCELSWQQGRWFLCVPFETTIKPGENQSRLVALDPGVRTFQTFYSPEMAGHIGYHDFGRLVRLCHHLDNLISRYSTTQNMKQRYRMRKAANRMRWKIRNLRDELHAKTVRFLVDHFDIILIPTFETSQMARREQCKLRSKTVRAMLTWAHYQFKERLKVVAQQEGKRVIEVNEAYTSKTCSWSGEVVQTGSSERIRGSDGIAMQRDMNSARGIFLRALVELPLLGSLQHALVNNAHHSVAFSTMRRV